MSTLEDNIKTLNEYHVMKVSKGKEIKAKVKTLDKKVKHLEEKLAANKVEQNKLERENNRTLKLNEFEFDYCDMKLKTLNELKNHIVSR